MPTRSQQLGLLVAVTMLVLYVELTMPSCPDESGLLRHLLEANIATSGHPASFGLVPGGGTVAYRIALHDADRLSGDDLMKQILALISSATARLHDVMSRHANRSAVTVPGSKSLHPSMKGVRS